MGYKIIYTNVLKMLMYRNLLTENDIKKIVSNKKFKDNELKVDTEKGIYTIFILDEDIQSINKSINVLNILKKDDNKIIVCKKFEKKTLEQLSDYKNVEIFTINFVLLNILEHTLQPRFEFIDKKDLESLNIKKSQFPKMESTDPVARCLNLKQGDIIKVIEKNESSIYNINYNIIIYAPISQITIF